MNFRLMPSDILVNINDRGDLLSKIKRWGVGPYEHVFLYIGEVPIWVTPTQEKPPAFRMLFESAGRGVVLQSLSNRYGQKVVVMRLKPQHSENIPDVLMEAIKLASDPQAYYDYSIIALHIIPKVILEKLHLPIPLKYQRNSAMICSEACAELFWRAGLLILFDDIVPLPGDFVTESYLLEEVWRGELCPEVI